MLNIKLKKDEDMFAEIQEAMNGIFETHYPHALQFNHYEFWQHAGRLYTPEDWKQFRLDPRVSEWFSTEMAMLAETKAFKLMNQVGDSRSTADAQQLNQMINYLKDVRQNQRQETIVVYAFVPLNQNEEAAPNVKLLESVPDEIENAIQRFNRSK